MSSSLDIYLSELTGRVMDALGDNVIGIYLHGSCAMGAFVPSRSDVDVLVVTRTSLSPMAKELVAESSSETALPCPGVGLELSVVTLSSLGDDLDQPSFELHLDTRESRVVDGRDRSGDPDLVSHVAMARARGRILVGPDASAILPPVDRARLLRVLSDDLQWGLENTRGGYAVLNACRALRFAREGDLCSKPEGGRWALEKGVGDSALIRSALRRQAGEDEHVDLEEATRFVGAAREELSQQAK
jgi:hypothetical protein